MAKQTQKSTAVATSPAIKNGLSTIVDDPREIIESVLIRGDLARLTPEQRTDYYMRVCQSVGLNPLTKPFEYLTLNGKMVLYALRSCTDQLRAIHDVSVLEMEKDEREGVYIVTSKVANGKGRADMAIGAVNIAGLKGEALANALMKGETKSKRRATLSICGLGFLDELEVEDIPAKAIQRVPSPDAAPEIVVEPEVAAEPEPAPAKPAKPAPKTAPKPPAAPKVDKPTPEAPEKAASEPKALRLTPHTLTPDDNSKTFPSWAARYIEAISHSTSDEELAGWREKNSELLQRLRKNVENYERVESAEAAMGDNLAAIKPKESAKPDHLEVNKGTLAEQASEDHPDPEKDPDAFVQWACKKIASFSDYDAANDFFNETIEPLSENLFPPDKSEIVGVLTRLDEKLAP